tara:strand:+ start:10705 stop:11031 length:327 start_codon:yes stop_codon:yes gene_type:complete
MVGCSHLLNRRQDKKSDPEHDEEVEKSSRKVSPKHELHDRFRVAHHKQPEEDRKRQNEVGAESHQPRHHHRRGSAPERRRSHHASDEGKNKDGDDKKKRRFSKAMDWL